jgi:CSLREA domain-containing protein
MAGIVLSASFATAPPARAVTFEVNIPSDNSDFSLNDTPNVCDTDGGAGLQCSLRGAIQEANNTTGTDVIEFNLPVNPNLPGSGRTFGPATALPQITSPVSIDGYTQPGASPNGAEFGEPLNGDPLVEIEGEGLPTSTKALSFKPGSGGSSVSGLVINHFPGTAIVTDFGVPVTVTGNYLGTDRSGEILLPNGAGIFNNGDGSEVGGPNPEDTNLIAGNTFGAISGNSPMEIIGNYVGVTADGRTVVGNGFEGISVSNAAGDNLIAQNIIAGSQANTAAFQPGDAIDVLNPASNSTFITQNRIFGNDGIGIDLDGNGDVTQNDLPDADGRTNFPVLKSATRKNGKTKLAGELKSTPDTLFSLEFYAADGSSRQGKQFLGQKSVTTGSDGVAAVKARFTQPGKDKFIVATATDTTEGTDGDTSEFSKPRKVK